VARICTGKQGHLLLLQENRSCSIRFLDEKTGAIRVVRTITQNPFLYLDLSPDDHFLLWTQADQYGSYLTLIENFR
jgi:hypothetical protein